jgi:hypothetical protein
LPKCGEITEKEPSGIHVPETDCCFQDLPGPQSDSGEVLTLAEMEKKATLSTLILTNFNYTEASRNWVSPLYTRRKIKEYNIEVK